MPLFSCRRVCIPLLLCACALAAFFLRERILPAGAEKAAPAVLRVGLEDHYPPMAFTDAQGKHTGFDRDMAEALCRQINARCEFVIEPFDDLLQKMISGGLDVMIAGLAALPERRQYMEFTEPYYRSSTIYIGRPGLPVTKEGLRGKRLGAQTGSMQLDILKKEWSDVATVVEAPFADLSACWPGARWMWCWPTPWPVTIS